MKHMSESGGPDEPDELYDGEVVVVQGRTDYVFYVRNTQFRVRHPWIHGDFKIPPQRHLRTDSQWFSFFTPEFMKPGLTFNNYHLVFQNEIMRHCVAPFLTPTERGALIAMFSELPNIVECDVNRMNSHSCRRISYEYESGILMLLGMTCDRFHVPAWLRGRLCE